MRPACGNCGYNCCCHCALRWNDEQDCYICKLDKCCDFDYRIHYVCFPCRNAWKASETWFTGDDDPKCSCGKDGTMVGMHLRAPKADDVKSWALIEKIVMHAIEDVEKSLTPKERIKLKSNGDWSKWRPFHQNCDGIKVNYPQHMREYDDFIQEVKKAYFVKK